MLWGGDDKKYSSCKNLVCFLNLFEEKIVYCEEWKKIPVYKNHSPCVQQFELREKFNARREEEIIIMSVVHELNHHNDYSKSRDSYYLYIVKNDKNIIFRDGSGVELK